MPPVGPVTRYALLGPGAVGGLYGGMLAAAGHDLHVLARSDAAELARDGLAVRSVWGDFHVRPVVHTDPATVPEVDVVLVALKTTANAALRTLLPSMVGPRTAVVLLQNGLGVEEEVARIVPGAAVLGGLCFVCALKDGPASVHHVDYGPLTVAEHGATTVTAVVRRVVDDFAAAGVPATAEADLAVARWRKLVWNMPFNGLSVVLDAGTDALLADPSTRALVVDLMQEVRDAAAACGAPLPEEIVDTMMTMTDSMVPYRTSMKLDFDAGRDLETEAIYGAPVRAAAAAGAPMRRVEALWRQVEFAANRRQTAPR